MMRDFLSIVGKSIGWASGIAVLVFILAFNVPLWIGGPGAHQAPLAAFIYAPLSFSLVFFICLLIQLRRTLNLSVGGKLSYFILLTLALIPSVYYINYFSIADIISSIRSVDLKDYTRAERMKHAPPLTDVERLLLLNSTQIKIRVGVVNQTFPPAYTRGLINVLQRMCLFDEVAELNNLQRADVIATIKGTMYGDKRGIIFSLHLPEDSNKKIDVDVYYTLGGELADTGGEANQYLDRLSVEVIKAVHTLFVKDNSIISDSMTGLPGAELSCIKNSEAAKEMTVMSMRQMRIYLCHTQAIKITVVTSLLDFLYLKNMVSANKPGKRVLI